MAQVAPPIYQGAPVYQAPVYQTAPAYQAPVYQAPVVQAAPIYQAPVVHAAPVVVDAPYADHYRHGPKYYDGPRHHGPRYTRPITSAGRSIRCRTRNAPAAESPLSIARPPATAASMLLRQAPIAVPCRVMMKREMFPIAKIYVPIARRASLKPATVDELAESILETGMKNPILVRPDGDRYVLVEGLHRLEACKKLGETTIAGYLVQARRH